VKKCVIIPGHKRQGKPVKQHVRCTKGAVTKTSEFTPAKNLKEAADYAHSKGVISFDTKGMSLEQANGINEWLDKVPKDAIPDVIGSSQTYNEYFSIKLKRKNKDFYGVSISSEFSFPLDAEERFKKSLGRFEDGKIFKNSTSDRFSQSNTKHGVFFSKAYKTPASITKRKLEINDLWNKKNGSDYFFNTEGKLTYVHEMGHVYDKRKGKSSSREWKDVSSRWYKQSGTTHLKTTSESFADGFAEYINQSSRLPDYVKSYFDSNLD